MGVRTGEQYVQGLRDDRRIYIKGEKVRDVTKYPPLQGVIRELVDLYDRQHQPNFKDLLTYRSPSSGDPVSTSFLIPATLEEVERRVRGERARAE
jgi:4-hydroxyphenylacetate 3-monooxygenase